MLIVCLGLGVNSTAVLVGLKQRGIRPDLILFSDTGGEKPETYLYLDILQEWIKKIGFPEIITLRYQHPSVRLFTKMCLIDPAIAIKFKMKYLTLEEECLNAATLPSLAYGSKTCSQKWKKTPQEKFIELIKEAQEIWKQGGKITTILGYDAGEIRRTIPNDGTNKKYLNWYPLIEWGWHRAHCILAIDKEGLPLPPKSSCFFCPANKKAEIRLLRENHPKLLARALQIEANTKHPGSVKGLGRRFSWAELMEEDIPTLDGWDSTINNCDCWDGGGLSQDQFVLQSFRDRSEP